MSLLLALPLLPLVVAGWLALSSRGGPFVTGWAVTVAAAFPVVAAALLGPTRIDLPELLVLGTSALVLDETSRAALLLFGGLWLTTGLLLTQSREQGRSVIALLVALSGAITLALAEGGPLIYTGMLVVGYGLYAIMAGEPGAECRRAGRALIVLLVVSDLLVFELLLKLTAHPIVGMPRGLILLGLAALVLRSSVPPAHAWLPPALATVGAPTATLLVAVPTGAGMVGVLKLLPAGVPEVGLVCILLGLTGAAWAAIAGLAQVQPRASLAYALAATAALLLMAVPAGVGSGGQLTWLVLALLATCAALPLVALQPAGWTRNIGIAAALLVHGLAGGQVALHAASAVPAWAGIPASLAAVAATLLLTVTARRTMPAARSDESAEATHLAYVPIMLAAAGLVLAWVARPPEFAYTWVAPVGIALGLIVFRLVPQRARPWIQPGDLLGPVERFVGFLCHWLRVFSLHPLPRIRDRLKAWARSLWDGEAWSRRVRHVDLKMGAWPATGLMMLLVALAAAFLLAIGSR